MTRNLVVHAVCAVVVASGAASAADEQSLDDGWPARWNKVGPVETGVVAGLGTSIIFLEFLLKSPSTPRWDKPILFEVHLENAEEVLKVQLEGNGTVVSKSTKRKKSA